MNYIVRMLILVFAFAVASCETEMIERFDEQNFETGGYMRTITPFPIPVFKVSKANMAGTKLEMVVEAVTKNFGAEFQSYDLTVQFTDRTAANGSNSKTDVALKSYPSSAYTPDPVTKYPRTTISITGQELQDALGLTLDQIAATDRFVINATMKLTTGKSYSAANSDPDVSGGAFYSSPFRYTVEVTE